MTMLGLITNNNFMNYYSQQCSEQSVTTRLGTITNIIVGNYDYYVMNNFWNNH